MYHDLISEIEAQALGPYADCLSQKITREVVKSPLNPIYT